MKRAVSEGAAAADSKRSAAVLVCVHERGLLVPPPEASDVFVFAWCSCVQCVWSRPAYRSWCRRYRRGEGETRPTRPTRGARSLLGASGPISAKRSRSAPRPEVAAWGEQPKALGVIRAIKPAAARDSATPAYERSPEVRVCDAQADPNEGAASSRPRVREQIVLR